MYKSKNSCSIDYLVCKPNERYRNEFFSMIFHSRNFGLTVQLIQTPPPRNFPRMSIDIFLSATSWSYLHEVACPLQLHFSQWKPFAAVPGFHGIWLYMGQHFSHLSPHVWRSHSHSWCWETIPPLNGTLLIFSIALLARYSTPLRVYQQNNLFSVTF